MTITVNGESYSTEIEELSVAALLLEKQVKSPDMVSVQLNGAFLPREKFDRTVVSDGDAVEFLYFMGGGAR